MESNYFQIPEDQISVDIKSSGRQRLPTDNVLNMTKSPLYLISSLDEFTRDYCSLRVGENLPATIPVVEYSAYMSGIIKYPDVLHDTFEPFLDDETLLKSAAAYERIKPTRILHHYHPGYPGWASTFKSSPSESNNLFLDKPVSDSTILLKVFSCVAKNSFEPLFGSITLYLNKGDELIRLSENFNFDVTADATKNKYTEVYKTLLSSAPGEISLASMSSDEASSTSSTASSAFNSGAGAIKTCLLRIPEDLRRDQDLFFVVQLSKVLSGDADKAVAPYMPRGTPPSSAAQLQRHEEQCNRLAQYRQVVGLGIIKVYDENGCVGVQGKPGVAFKLYAQKTVLSEAQLLTVTTDAYLPRRRLLH